MTSNAAHESNLAKLIDEQLEIAACQTPGAGADRGAPSPADHEERKTAHASFEDVLLGNAQASPEMLEELAALEATPALSDEELARQALAGSGADNEVSTKQ